LKIDPELYSYCTDRQREVLEAYEEHGTGPAAAEALGGTDRTYPDKVLRDVRKKAAREGYAPGHFQDGVAPGYLMGKVTVQRGPGGVERVWERQSPDQTRALEALREVVEGIQSDIEPAPRVKAPAVANSDLCNLFTFTDYHLGMLA